jgi:hypothetical protein
MGAPTTPPLYEVWHDGGFLVSEANGHQSRDQVTLGGGALVLAGTVLGAITASGVFAPLNTGASDGSQTAAGILFGTRDTTSANKQAVVVLRNAEINASELIWPAGATGPQIATATGQLKALGVILR